MTVVYRFFDSDNQLLYVGLAVDPGARWKDHTRTPWWAHARYVTLDHHPSRKLARAAETEAIKSEDPRWNVKHHRHRPMTVHGRYLEIADDLRGRIGRGKEFPPGAQLPTRGALCERYDVSEITIDAAMRELRRDGLTETVHGRGVFVRDEIGQPDQET